MVMLRRLHRLCVAATVMVVIAVAGSAQELGPVASKTNAQDPLNMLVLGDSIMWGQGLEDRDKFWWRIKDWLEEKTGREVMEKIEAHSGAAIEAPTRPERMFVSKDGEVNLIWPTINEQVDDALKYYNDPARVDLILVNGCINDVDVRNLLDASTSLDLLATNIREKCGGRMQTLLRRITSEFKSAYVVVTNYYRIVSPMSADNPFIRMLVKKLTTQNPETRRMSDRQMREKLVAISELWYQLSTSSLTQAVEAVNTELGTGSSPQRILFAEIQFAPEHSFSAPDSLLWNFKFGSTNLSGLRKAIVVLTLGTAAYKPNDQVSERRNKSCRETYKRPKEKEDKAKKERREVGYLACRYASLGHPNKMGSLIYAEAIKGQIQWIIPNAGWISKPSQLQEVRPN